MLLLGAIGIVVLTTTAEMPEGLDVPRILLAVNPLILLLALGTMGIWASQKMGFQSCLLKGDYIDWSLVRKTGAYAIGVGAVVAILDHMSVAIWRADPDSGIKSLIEAASLTALFTGVTYGGITEEIMMRWGLLSGLALILSTVLKRGLATDVALVLAALLFAAGHLPAVFAAGIDLTPALLARILVLNAALGIWFGWLYTRRNLESAIAAHVGIHVGAFLLGSFWI